MPRPLGETGERWKELSRRAADEVRWDPTVPERDGLTDAQRRAKLQAQMELYVARLDELERQQVMIEECGHEMEKVGDVWVCGRCGSEAADRLVMAEFECPNR